MGNIAMVFHWLNYFTSSQPSCLFSIAPAFAFLSMETRVGRFKLNWDNRSTFWRQQLPQQHQKICIDQYAFYTILLLPLSTFRVRREKNIYRFNYWTLIGSSACSITAHWSSEFYLCVGLNSLAILIDDSLI